MRDIAFGLLQNYLLAKHDENLHVELCHDLDRAYTFEHVEKDIQF